MAYRGPPQHVGVVTTPLRYGLSSIWCLSTQVAGNAVNQACDVRQCVHSEKPRSSTPADYVLRCRLALRHSFLHFFLRPQDFHLLGQAGMGSRWGGRYHDWFYAALFVLATERCVPPISAPSPDVPNKSMPFRGLRDSSCLARRFLGI